MNSDWHIEITNATVLKEGQTTKPEYCGVRYVIYVSMENMGQKIRINARFIPRGDKITIDRHYDRALCDTMDEYRRLSLDYIECQAYGAWMDGAK